MSSVRDDFFSSSALFPLSDDDDSASCSSSLLSRRHTWRNRGSPAGRKDATRSRPLFRPSRTDFSSPLRYGGALYGVRSSLRSSPSPVHPARTKEASLGSSFSPSVSFPGRLPEQGPTFGVPSNNGSVESAVFEVITRAAEKAVEQALKDHYANWSKKNETKETGERGRTQTRNSRLREPLPITEAKVRITPNHLKVFPPGRRGEGGSLEGSSPTITNGSFCDLPSFPPVTCRFSVLPNEADPEGGRPTLRLLETFHEDDEGDPDTLEGEFASLSTGLKAGQLKGSSRSTPPHSQQGRSTADCRPTQNALWQASSFPPAPSTASSVQRSNRGFGYPPPGLPSSSSTANVPSPFFPYHPGPVPVPGPASPPPASPVCPGISSPSCRSSVLSSHLGAEASSLKNFSGFSSSFFSKLVCIEGGAGSRESRRENEFREKSAVSQCMAKQRGGTSRAAGGSGAEATETSGSMTADGEEEGPAQEDEWPDVASGAVVSSTSQEHQLELRKLVKGITTLWKLQKRQNELVNKLKEWARGCYLMSGKLPGRAQLIADLPGVRAECCRTRAAIREQRQRVSRQLACIVGAQISDEAAGPLVFSEEIKEELEGGVSAPSPPWSPPGTRDRPSPISRRQPCGQKRSGPRPSGGKESPAVIGEKLDRIHHLLTSLQMLLNDRDPDEALCEEDSSQQMFRRRLCGILHQVQVVQKQLASHLEREGKCVSLKSLLDDACPSLTTSTTALPEEGEERNYGEALLPSGLLQETPVLSPSSEQEGKAAADPKREEGTSVTQERRESSHSSFTSAEERLQQELRRRGEAVDKQTTANDEEDENSTRHHSTGADTDSTAASSSCITPNGRTASAMLTTILKQELRDVRRQRDVLEDRLRASLARVDVQQEAIGQLVSENRKRLSELLTLRGSQRILCYVYSSDKLSADLLHQSLLSPTASRSAYYPHPLKSLPLENEEQTEAEQDELLVVSGDTTVSVTGYADRTSAAATTQQATRTEGRRATILEGVLVGDDSCYTRIRSFSPAALAAVSTQAAEVVRSTLRGGRAQRGLVGTLESALRQSRKAKTFEKSSCSRHTKGRADLVFDRVYGDEEESPAVVRIFEDCCDLLQSATKEGLNFCLVALGPRTAAKTLTLYGAPPSLLSSSSVSSSSEDDFSAGGFLSTPPASVSPRGLGVAQLISRLIFEELETQCARLPRRPAFRKSGTRTQVTDRTASQSSGILTGKQRGRGRGAAEEGEEEAPTYTVHYSVLEIRQEQLSDGLVTDRRQAKKIDIKKDRKTGEVKVTNLVSRKAEKPEDLFVAFGKLSEKCFREIHLPDLGIEEDSQDCEGSGCCRLSQRELKLGAARACHVVFFVHTEVHDPSSGSVWRGKIALVDVATSRDSTVKAPFNCDSSLGPQDTSGGFSSFLSLGRSDEEREAVCLNKTLASLRKIFLSQRLKMRSCGCRGSGRDRPSASNQAAGAVLEAARCGDLNTRALFHTSKLTQVLEDCLDTLYARAVLLVCLPSSGSPEFPFQEFALTSTKSSQNASRCRHGE